MDVKGILGSVRESNYTKKSGGIVEQYDLGIVDERVGLIPCQILKSAIGVVPSVGAMVTAQVAQIRPASWQAMGSLFIVENVRVLNGAGAAVASEFAPPPTSSKR